MTMPPNADLQTTGIIERIDTILAHVMQRHAAGLTWNGIDIGEGVILERRTRPPQPARSPLDPSELLGAPAFGDRGSMRRDIHTLRRLLGTIAARLRYASAQRPVVVAIADGLLIARGATSVRDMRERMHQVTTERLRRFRRDVMRRIDAVGSVDIRLDAWAAVGAVGGAHPEVRTYLDGVLQQQADYASFGRAGLGQLVETRRSLDLALERVELIAGTRSAATRSTRTHSGPLTLAAIARPTAPSSPERAVSAHR